ncbi:hypothetical protein ACIQF6_06420 [Kitasatospora sp. NPDC092948]|uniref:SCO2583/SCO2584 N-terminal domain-containing protein n=1 Tax=Kitasatospora sp. NPDC092948 TaxID=3364088 RepID=UPI003823C8DB
MPRTEGPGPDDGKPGHEGDPFEGLVLDEEFVRGAENTEASGRARMLTARWKENPPPENDPWRPPTEPAGAPKVKKPHPVRNALLVLLVPLGLLGVMVATGNPKGKPQASSSELPSVGPATATPSGLPSQVATATPSSLPSQVAPETPTAERPWAGSPAEAWPSGPDALALPQATAVGVFDQDRVAKDLELAKAYLVATNLDPKVMAGGYPQDAIDLTNRISADRMASDLANPSKENDPATWVSRFDPAWAVPVTDEVKVHALITFEDDGDQGLMVHTDVTYVYALKPGPQVGRAVPSTPPPPSQDGGSQPTGGSAGVKSVGLIRAEPGAVEVQREVVRRKIDFRFADPARFQVKKDKVSVARWDSERANTLCGFNGGYLRPSFRADQPAGGASPRSGPTTDPYDVQRPMTEGGECGTASRS